MKTPAQIASAKRYKAMGLRARKYKRRTEFSLEDLTAWFEGHLNDTCECGAPAKTLDHVIPLARGGRHALSNFQMLCRSCNSRKCAWLAGEQRSCPWERAGYQMPLMLRRMPRQSKRVKKPTKQVFEAGTLIWIGNNWYRCPETIVRDIL